MVMMRTFELTDDEFSTLCNALEYATDEAVHDEGELAFKNLHREMIEQYEHQEPYKATESDRYE